LLKCLVCRSIKISPDGPNGEKVCYKCGLVTDNNYIVPMYSKWTPEWYSNWTQNESETLKEWLITLKTVSCQLQIPRFPFQEEAAIKIRKEKKLFSESKCLSKHKRATIIALMHLVLKQYNKIRPIKKMCQELKIDEKKVLKQLWKLKAINNKKQIININRKTSKNYLLTYGTQITKKKETLFVAKRIVTAVQNLGGNPISTAAGALYYASKKTKNPISKYLIGNIFSISPRTVYANEQRIRKLMQKTFTQSYISSVN
jgi:transcription initiation factor TFIIIB Brf1 subunit/transcription initiation factor TFIIB